MEEIRPTPDDILKKIGKSDKNDRGKLKIFFGFAAGVGKTYAMLDAAHTAKKTGIDVLVGYVEPHTRPETMELLNGLELLENKIVEYKGIRLKEFDLDSALKRKPQLILVDELAHTNAEGCRHKKRYHDIDELLNAGIDVYTTVNVQHLESLNDIVASITHVTVKERIPDWVFDQAAQVELVDIEPEELISRLNAGKIYKTKQVERALDHFFTLDNLVALREIALRRTADRVNKQAENSKAVSKNGDYFTGEHILVCLSPSPSNQKVIRAAARMSSAFHGYFTALFVETTSFTNMSKESLQRLRSNLKLAEQLGAKIATVYGDDIPYQISEYAKAGGVSKIIIGRTANKKRILFNKLNFVEQLTRLAPNLDIYIIPDNLSSGKTKMKIINNSREKFHPIDFIKMLSILTLCTIIGYLFYLAGLTETNVITVYILGVLIISNRTNGRIYGILSSFLGVMVFNFFFTEPYYSFHAYGAEYPVTFSIMLISALITSTLTMRVKNQARAASVNVFRTEILLQTSRRLQRAENKTDIIAKASDQIQKLLNKSVIFYSMGSEGMEDPFVRNGEGQKLDTAYISESEEAVAEWVFKNGKGAGATTDTIPGAKSIYYPVLYDQKVLAVVGIPLKNGEEIEPFERGLLLGIISETAFAIDKYNINEERKKSSLQAEKEHLRANLLRAISHDLRTPLTSISGSADFLLANGESCEKEEMHRMLQNIYVDSMWLINLVENLLAVTRIEDGRLSIKTQPELIQELITEALSHVDNRDKSHSFKIDIPDEYIMANVDVRLIVQVIINIVDNAVKYTDTGSEIKISAFHKNDKVVVEIADNGSGISSEDKKHIFDMYYTADTGLAGSRRGLGLGLALCRSIIEAHGGEIYVSDNNRGGGTIFGFTLDYVVVKNYE